MITKETKVSSIDELTEPFECKTFGVVKFGADCSPQYDALFLLKVIITFFNGREQFNLPLRCDTR